MTIKEKLLLIKQINEANEVSIKRYLEREENDAIFAIIRRETRTNNILREIAKEIVGKKGE